MKLKSIIQFIIQLMKTIKTAGMQYIETDEVPSSPPPDANRPAICLNTASGFEYKWNIPNQAWVAIPKVYCARLIQTGNDDPIATEFENTLGTTVTWTRQSEGVYRATLGAAFSASKGFWTIGPLLADDAIYSVGAVFSGTILIVTTVSELESPLFTDGLLNHTAVELRIYP